MADLKLSRLPDRTPVKMTITISPDLAADLALYADLYQRTYAREEPITELVPAMIRSFLDADRAFVRARREGGERERP
ncbi:DUF2274 domain-containing protein [Priestia megaterium]|uniref:DUF2274 domain-containing protein n=1 Tax=Priestia megaterium TaxID=1404 RepID=UPI00372CF747